MRLYRALLVLDLVAVTALVGSFNVYVYKILTVGKLIDARLRLALEIRVDVARSALYLYNVHSAEFADALQQVYRRDYRAFQSILFGERHERLAHTLAPEPHRVCGTLAFSLARLVYRVVFQQIVAFTIIS